MRAIILDSEKLALRNAVSVFEQHRGISLAGAYTEPEEALSLVLEGGADVAFLDIDIPGINVFDIAHQMIKIKSEINIVAFSSFMEYAVKAFEIGAIDYVLKPLSEKRLAVTVERILRRCMGNGAEYLLTDAKKPDGFAGKQADGKKMSKVAGWKNERIRLLKPDEIMFFYSEGKKTLIHSVYGVFESKGSLTDLEQHLDENTFFRCHRSYLINLDFVEYIDPWFNQTYIVKLRGNNEDIPVSRSSSKNLKRLITL